MLSMEDCIRSVNSHYDVTPNRTSVRVTLLGVIHPDQPVLVETWCVLRN